MWGEAGVWVGVDVSGGGWSARIWVNGPQRRALGLRPVQADGRESDVEGLAPGGSRDLAVKGCERQRRPRNGWLQGQGGIGVRAS